MTVAFGLVAALFYGLSDFAGGFASRASNAAAVLLVGYPVGAALMTVLLPAFGGAPSSRAVVYGVLGGVAGMVGVVLLYSLMTTAPINVISPVTAVLASVVPVMVGTLIGERPHLHSWAGIALGLAAIVLVSRTAQDHPHGRVGPSVLALALLSGLGFGLYFVFLARAGAGTGLWPLVVSRWTSSLLIAPLAWAVATGRLRLGGRGTGAPRGRLLAIAAVGGAMDALANLFFLLAARHGLLSVASVLTSLYPAVTVLLAVTVLHERTTAVQRAGLGLAAAAIVLITV